MRSLTLGALALASSVANGYLDTSPFFMFSSLESANPWQRYDTLAGFQNEMPTSLQQLKPASSITSDISKLLSRCPSDFYILISQSGVRSEDYTSQKTTPALSQRITRRSKSPIGSSASIADVVGTVDVKQWTDILEQKCGVQVTDIDATAGTIPTSYDMLPGLLNVYFPPPTELSRAKDLADHDAFLASILDLIPSQNYTLLYTTTPDLSSPGVSVAETGEYQMDAPLQETTHTDLKRDMSLHRLSRRNNQTVVEGPLFEKYQFLGPGIFMGFLVGFLLLSILYVAISAVASLQVSYAAFDKENGQLSTKKAQ